MILFGLIIFVVVPQKVLKPLGVAVEDEGTVEASTRTGVAERQLRNARPLFFRTAKVHLSFAQISAISFVGKAMRNPFGIISI